MNFILDRLFANDLEKLIQQTGDNQMDAIRHRAAVRSTYLFLLDPLTTTAVVLKFVSAKLWEIKL